MKRSSNFKRAIVLVAMLALLLVVLAGCVQTAKDNFNPFVPPTNDVNEAGQSEPEGMKVTLSGETAIKMLFDSYINAQASGATAANMLDFSFAPYFSMNKNGKDTTYTFDVKGSINMTDNNASVFSFELIKAEEGADSIIILGIYGKDGNIFIDSRNYKTGSMVHQYYVDDMDISFICKTLSQVLDQLDADGFLEKFSVKDMLETTGLADTIDDLGINLNNFLKLDGTLLDLIFSLVEKNSTTNANEMSYMIDKGNGLTQLVMPLTINGLLKEISLIGGIVTDLMGEQSSIVQTIVNLLLGDILSGRTTVQMYIRADILDNKFQTAALDVVAEGSTRNEYEIGIGQLAASKDEKFAQNVRASMPDVVSTNRASYSFTTLSLDVGVDLNVAEHTYTLDSIDTALGGALAGLLGAVDGQVWRQKQINIGEGGLTISLLLKLRVEVDLKNNANTRIALELFGAEDKKLRIGVYYKGAKEALYIDTSGMGGAKIMVDSYETFVPVSEATLTGGKKRYELNEDGSYSVNANGEYVKDTRKINLNKIIASALDKYIPQIPSILSIVNNALGTASAAELDEEMQAIADVLYSGDVVVPHFGLVNKDSAVSAADEEEGGIDVLGLITGILGSAVIKKGDTPLSLQGLYVYMTKDIIDSIFVDALGLNLPIETLNLELYQTKNEGWMLNLDLVMAKDGEELVSANINVGINYGNPDAEFDAYFDALPLVSLADNNNGFISNDFLSKADDGSLNNLDLNLSLETRVKFSVADESVFDLSPLGQVLMNLALTLKAEDEVDVDLGVKIAANVNAGVLIDLIKGESEVSTAKILNAIEARIDIGRYGEDYTIMLLLKEGAIYLDASKWGMPKYKIDLTDILAGNFSLFGKNTNSAAAAEARAAYMQDEVDDGVDTLGLIISLLNGVNIDNSALELELTNRLFIILFDALGIEWIDNAGNEVQPIYTNGTNLRIEYDGLNLSKLWIELNVGLQQDTADLSASLGLGHIAIGVGKKDLSKDLDLNNYRDIMNGKNVFLGLQLEIDLYLKQNNIDLDSIIGALIADANAALGTTININDTISGGILLTLMVDLDLASNSASNDSAILIELRRVSDNSLMLGLYYQHADYNGDGVNEGRLYLDTTGTVFQPVALELDLINLLGGLLSSSGSALADEGLASAIDLGNLNPLILLGNKGIQIQVMQGITDILFGLLAGDKNDYIDVITSTKYIESTPELEQAILDAATKVDGEIVYYQKYYDQYVLVEGEFVAYDAEVHGEDAVIYAKSADKAYFYLKVEGLDEAILANAIATDAEGTDYKKFVMKSSGGEYIEITPENQDQYLTNGGNAVIYAQFMYIPVSYLVASDEQNIAGYGTQRQYAVAYNDEITKYVQLPATAEDLYLYEIFEGKAAKRPNTNVDIRLQLPELGAVIAIGKVDNSDVSSVATGNYFGGLGIGIFIWPNGVADADRTAENASANIAIKLGNFMFSDEKFRNEEYNTEKYGLSDYIKNVVAANIIKTADVSDIADLTVYVNVEAAIDLSAYQNDAATGESWAVGGLLSGLLGDSMADQPQLAAFIKTLLIKLNIPADIETVIGLRIAGNLKLGKLLTSSATETLDKVLDMLVDSEVAIEIFNDYVHAEGAKLVVGIYIEDGMLYVSADGSLVPNTKFKIELDNVLALVSGLAASATGEALAAADLDIVSILGIINGAVDSIDINNTADNRSLQVNLGSKLLGVILGLIADVEGVELPELNEANSKLIINTTRRVAPGNEGYVAANDYVLKLSLGLDPVSIAIVLGGLEIGLSEDEDVIPGDAPLSEDTEYKTINELADNVSLNLDLNIGATLKEGVLPVGMLVSTILQELGYDIEFPLDIDLQDDIVLDLSIQLQANLNLNNLEESEIKLAIVNNGRPASEEKTVLGMYFTHYTDGENEIPALYVETNFHSQGGVANRWKIDNFNLLDSLLGDTLQSLIGVLSSEVAEGSAMAAAEEAAPTAAEILLSLQENSIKLEIAEQLILSLLGVFVEDGISDELMGVIDELNAAAEVELLLGGDKGVGISIDVYTNYVDLAISIMNPQLSLGAFTNIWADVHDFDDEAYWSESGIGDYINDMGALSLELGATVEYDLSNGVYSLDSLVSDISKADFLKGSETLVSIADMLKTLTLDMICMNTRGYIGIDVVINLLSADMNSLLPEVGVMLKDLVMGKLDENYVVVSEDGKSFNAIELLGMLEAGIFIDMNGRKLAISLGQDETEGETYVYFALGEVGGDNFKVSLNKLISGIQGISDSTGSALAAEETAETKETDFALIGKILGKAIASISISRDNGLDIALGPQLLQVLLTDVLAGLLGKDFAFSNDTLNMLTLTSPYVLAGEGKTGIDDVEYLNLDETRYVKYNAESATQKAYLEDNANNDFGKFYIINNDTHAYEAYAEGVSPATAVKYVKCSYTKFISAGNVTDDTTRYIETDDLTTYPTGYKAYDAEADGEVAQKYVLVGTDYLPVYDKVEHSGISWSESEGLGIDLIFADNNGDKGLGFSLGLDASLGIKGYAQPVLPSGLDSDDFTTLEDVDDTGMLSISLIISIDLNGEDGQYNLGNLLSQFIDSETFDISTLATAGGLILDIEDFTGLTDLKVTLAANIGDLVSALTATEIDIFALLKQIQLAIEPLYTEDDAEVISGEKLIGDVKGGLYLYNGNLYIDYINESRGIFAMNIEELFDLLGEDDTAGTTSAPAKAAADDDEALLQLWIGEYVSLGGMASTGIAIKLTTSLVEGLLSALLNKNVSFADSIGTLAAEIAINTAVPRAGVDDVIYANIGTLEAPIYKDITTLTADELLGAEGYDARYDLTTKYVKSFDDVDDTKDVYEVQKYEFSLDAFAIAINLQVASLNVGISIGQFDIGIATDGDNDSMNVVPNAVKVYPVPEESVLDIGLDLSLGLTMEEGADKFYLGEFLNNTGLLGETVLDNTLLPVNVPNGTAEIRLRIELALALNLTTIDNSVAVIGLYGEAYDGYNSDGSQHLMNDPVTLAMIYFKDGDLLVDLSGLGFGKVKLTGLRLSNLLGNPSGWEAVMNLLGGSDTTEETASSALAAAYPDDEGRLTINSDGISVKIGVAIINKLLEMLIQPTYEQAADGAYVLVNDTYVLYDAANAEHSGLTRYAKDESTLNLIKSLGIHAMVEVTTDPVAVKVSAAVSQLIGITIAITNIKIGNTDAESALENIDVNEYIEAARINFTKDEEGKVQASFDILLDTVSLNLQIDVAALFTDGMFIGDDVIVGSVGDDDVGLTAFVKADIDVASLVGLISNGIDTSDVGALLSTVLPMLNAQISLVRYDSPEYEILGIYIYNGDIYLSLQGMGMPSIKITNEFLGSVIGALTSSSSALAAAEEEESLDIVALLPDLLQGVYLVQKSVRIALTNDYFVTLLDAILFPGSSYYQDVMPEPNQNEPDTNTNDNFSGVIINFNNLFGDNREGLLQVDLDMYSTHINLDIFMPLIEFNKKTISLPEHLANPSIKTMDTGSTSIDLTLSLAGQLKIDENGNGVALANILKGIVGDLETKLVIADDIDLRFSIGLSARLDFNLAEKSFGIGALDLQISLYRVKGNLSYSLAQIYYSSSDEALYLDLSYFFQNQQNAAVNNLGKLKITGIDIVGLLGGLLSGSSSTAALAAAGDTEAWVGGTQNTVIYAPAKGKAIAAPTEYVLVNKVDDAGNDISVYNRYTQELYVNYFNFSEFDAENAEHAALQRFSRTNIYFYTANENGGFVYDGTNYVEYDADNAAHADLPRYIQAIKYNYTANADGEYVGVPAYVLYDKDVPAHAGLTGYAKLGTEAAPEYKVLYVKDGKNYVEFKCGDEVHKYKARFTNEILTEYVVYDSAVHGEAAITYVKVYDPTTCSYNYVLSTADNSSAPTLYLQTEFGYDTYGATGAKYVYVYTAYNAATHTNFTRYERTTNEDGSYTYTESATGEYVKDYVAYDASNEEHKNEVVYGDVSKYVLYDAENAAHSALVRYIREETAGVVNYIVDAEGDYVRIDSRDRLYIQSSIYRLSAVWATVESGSNKANVIITGKAMLGLIGKFVDNSTITDILDMLLITINAERSPFVFGADISILDAYNDYKPALSLHLNIFGFDHTEENSDYVGSSFDFKYTELKPTDVNNYRELVNIDLNKILGAAEILDVLFDALDFGDDGKLYLNAQITLETLVKATGNDPTNWADFIANILGLSVEDIAVLLDVDYGTLATIDSSKFVIDIAAIIDAEKLLGGLIAGTGLNLEGTEIRLSIAIDSLFLSQELDGNTIVITIIGKDTDGLTGIYIDLSNYRNKGKHKLSIDLAGLLGGALSSSKSAVAAADVETGMLPENIFNILNSLLGEVRLGDGRISIKLRDTFVGDLLNTYGGMNIDKTQSLITGEVFLDVANLGLGINLFVGNVDKDEDGNKISDIGIKLNIGNINLYPSSYATGGTFIPVATRNDYNDLLTTVLDIDLEIEYKYASAETDDDNPPVNLSNILSLVETLLKKDNLFASPSVLLKVDAGGIDATYTFKLHAHVDLGQLFGKKTLARDSLQVTLEMWRQRDGDAAAEKRIGVYVDGEDIYIDLASLGLPKLYVGDVNLGEILKNALSGVSGLLGGASSDEGSALAAADIADAAFREKWGNSLLSDVAYPYFTLVFRPNRIAIGLNAELINSVLETLEGVLGSSIQLPDIGDLALIFDSSSGDMRPSLIARVSDEFYFSLGLTQLKINGNIKTDAATGNKTTAAGNPVNWDIAADVMEENVYQYDNVATGGNTAYTEVYNVASGNIGLERVNVGFDIAIRQDGRNTNPSMSDYGSSFEFYLYALLSDLLKSENLGISFNIGNGTNVIGYDINLRASVNIAVIVGALTGSGGDWWKDIALYLALTPNNGSTSYKPLIRLYKQSGDNDVYADLSGLSLPKVKLVGLSSLIGGLVSSASAALASETDGATAAAAATSQLTITFKQNGMRIDLGMGIIEGILGLLGDTLVVGEKTYSHTFRYNNADYPRSATLKTITIGELTIPLPGLSESKAISLELEYPSANKGISLGLDIGLGLDNLDAGNSISLAIDNFVLSTDASGYNADGSSKYVMYGATNGVINQTGTNAFQDVIDNSRSFSGLILSDAFGINLVNILSNVIGGINPNITINWNKKLTHYYGTDTSDSYSAASNTTIYLQRTSTTTSTAYGDTKNTKGDNIYAGKIEAYIDIQGSNFQSEGRLITAWLFNNLVYIDLGALSTLTSNGLIGSIVGSIAGDLANMEVTSLDLIDLVGGLTASEATAESEALAAEINGAIAAEEEESSLLSTITEIIGGIEINWWYNPSVPGKTQGSLPAANGLGAGYDISTLKISINAKGFNSILFNLYYMLFGLSRDYFTKIGNTERGWQANECTLEEFKTLQYETRKAIVTTGSPTGSTMVSEGGKNYRCSNCYKFCVYYLQNFAAYMIGDLIHMPILASVLQTDGGLSGIGNKILREVLSGLLPLPILDESKPSYIEIVLDKSKIGTTGVISEIGVYLNKEKASSTSTSYSLIGVDSSSVSECAEIVIKLNKGLEMRSVTEVREYNTSVANFADESNNFANSTVVYVEDAFNPVELSQASLAGNSSIVNKVDAKFYGINDYTSKSQNGQGATANAILGGTRVVWDTSTVNMTPGATSTMTGYALNYPVQTVSVTISPMTGFKGLYGYFDAKGNFVKATTIVVDPTKDPERTILPGETATVSELPSMIVIIRRDGVLQILDTDYDSEKVVEVTIEGEKYKTSGKFGWMEPSNAEIKRGGSINVDFWYKVGQAWRIQKAVTVKYDNSSIADGIIPSTDIFSILNGGVASDFTANSIDIIGNFGLSGSSIAAGGVEVATETGATYDAISTLVDGSVLKMTIDNSGLTAEELVESEKHMAGLEGTFERYNGDTLLQSGTYEYLKASESDDASILDSLLGLFSSSDTIADAGTYKLTVTDVGYTWLNSIDVVLDNGTVSNVEVIRWIFSDLDYDIDSPENGVKGSVTAVLNLFESKINAETLKREIVNAEQNVSIDLSVTRYDMAGFTSDKDSRKTMDIAFNQYGNLFVVDNVNGNYMYVKDVPSTVAAEDGTYPNYTGYVLYDEALNAYRVGTDLYSQNFLNKKEVYVQVQYSRLGSNVYEYQPKDFTFYTAEITTALGKVRIFEDVELTSGTAMKIETTAVYSNDVYSAGSLVTKGYEQSFVFDISITAKSAKKAVMLMTREQAQTFVAGDGIATATVIFADGTSMNGVNIKAVLRDEADNQLINVTGAGVYTTTATVYKYDATAEGNEAKDFSKEDVKLEIRIYN